jgi:hypothetical protein
MKWQLEGNQVLNKKTKQKHTLLVDTPVDFAVLMRAAGVIDVMTDDTFGAGKPIGHDSHDLVVDCSAQRVL